jgi:hypothetical protein
MSLTPETARERLWNLVVAAVNSAARPSEPYLRQAVDRIVAAEMRELLALHPGGSLNYWVSRRADELEHPAVDK